MSIDVADSSRRHRHQSGAAESARRSRDSDRSRDQEHAAARRLEHRMVLLALVAAIATVISQRWPGT